MHRADRTTTRTPNEQARKKQTYHPTKYKYYGEIIISYVVLVMRVLYYVIITLFQFKQQLGQQAVMAPQIVTYDPTNLYQQPNLLEQQQQQQMLVSQAN